MPPLIALLFAVLLAAPSARAGEVARHSGLITALDAGRRTLTLDEIGPWHPGTRGVQEVVALTPGTRCVRVSRATGRAQDGWPRGFDQWPLAPTALREGDYATVAVTQSGGHPVALSITVLRPDGPGAPRPSPTRARGRGIAEPRRVG
jgi:hypothetical protein